MDSYPKPLLRLMEGFARLPGIGKKSAERLAFHVLKMPEAHALDLAQSIHDVKKSLHSCTQCFNLAERDLCEICADPRRDQSVVCVVEQPKDLMAFESTGCFHGVYHVLLGHLAPLEGMHPENLTADMLVARVKKGVVKEVILATNPDLEGDGTALYLQETLKPLGVQVTRIARGIPAGSAVEYASKAILQDALEGRRGV